MDFLTDVGGRLELFESKWTELPSVSDTVNLQFVRAVVGQDHVDRAAVICRTPHDLPLAGGIARCP